MTEFYRIHHPSVPNKICYVAYTGSGCSAEIQYFGTRFDVDFLEPTKNPSGKLRTERVPDSIFSLCSLRSLDRNSLLPIDRFSRIDVAGNQQIFLSSSYEHTCLLAKIGKLALPACRWGSITTLDPPLAPLPP